MEFGLGFLIAFIIAITGVGAGTITAPLLILVLHVPIAVSVGTALAYSTAVKAVVVPLQVMRKQINWKVLAVMLAGGLPGVIVGTLLFKRFGALKGHAFFFGALGTVIVFSSAWHLFRHFRPNAISGHRPARMKTIGALMFPIAAEVGFSSSGAGALGSLALMSLSPLSAAQVVGTDLAFAFCVTLLGSGLHFADGSIDKALLVKLVIGGLVGALAGSAVAPRVPNKQLRLALSVVLLALGLQFCYQAVAKQLSTHSSNGRSAAVHGAEPHALALAHPQQ
ncbi:sulfite exporter TauE/SafE family protein [Silvibacterium dinghuense]|uniref:Probable membrane transporter protein n=1 Tax=Silvibacterium dinghuense TaxID=1560006 RepID=A0A4Q1SKA6_9BACT|nr:sulfite exporter TauE/SafE family protein [Silvibacterium dinghuense]RXS97889.1 sulfite exporter TauE/SafE family protein [Silvibacterium dinghuense]GGH02770.1 UPF0721 transmembrane protein [Silvibacterium dinghuense]